MGVIGVRNGNRDQELLEVPVVVLFQYYVGTGYIYLRVCGFVDSGIGTVKTASILLPNQRREKNQFQRTDRIVTAPGTVGRRC